MDFSLLSQELKKYLDTGIISIALDMEIKNFLQHEKESNVIDLMKYLHYKFNDEDKEKLTEMCFEYVNPPPKLVNFNRHLDIKTFNGTLWSRAKQGLLSGALFSSSLLMFSQAELSRTFIGAVNGLGMGIVSTHISAYFDAQAEKKLVDASRCRYQNICIAFIPVYPDDPIDFKKIENEINKTGKRLGYQ